MSGGQEQLEIRFRLPDGSDIGELIKDCQRYQADPWGKILENNRTLWECKNPILDVSGGITTMHVVIRPPPSRERNSLPKETKCGCIIL
ncbi:unnamed protein product [Spirodela intermedia]|uniref:UBL3-like ubiquitin domain-containing protein n=1 Tax=Spirodela intermedia TaxID=51605 RepID=A0A7I8JAX8_SPIIN|nr:unnamed protein product [Spirodela intermedia]CAA6667368.1 unnamed protein product [Spirodela intermedia]